MEQDVKAAVKLRDAAGGSNIIREGGFVCSPIQQHNNLANGLYHQADGEVEQMVSGEQN